MKQRGRRSTASMQVAAPLAAERAVEPEAFLSPKERAVWDSVVASKPADWFTSDTLPLLEGFCRAVAMTRWLAPRIAEVQAAEPLDFVKLSALLKAQDREQRGASSLATKLRLTIQSRYQPSTAGLKAATVLIDPLTGRPQCKPWNFTGE